MLKVGQVIRGQVPQASSVQLCRCSCGGQHCNVVSLVLLDDDDQPFASFGFDLSEWPETLSGWAREIAEIEMELGEAEGGHVRIMDATRRSDQTITLDVT